MQIAKFNSKFTLRKGNLYNKFNNKVKRNVKI